MLYDYFLNVGFIGTIGFAIPVCILLGLIISLSVHTVRLFFSKDRKTERFNIFAHLFVLIVPGILFGFMCSLLVQTLMYDREYASGSYEICTGKLYNVDYVRNDYRGEELYSISFDVGELSFTDNNISIDKTEVEKIKTAEGRDVTVCYKIEDEAQFIYKMFIADDG